MRSSGILLPISSLPSRYGIGGFSREAYEFADQLARAGQSNWQILPLGPTGYGDSPYQAFSTYAGNPYFISLDTLREEGLLTEEECREADCGENPGYVDYGRLYQTRFPVLRKAFRRFRPGAAFAQFAEEQAFWLEDYCLFMAIKNQQGGACWTDWPVGLKNRDPKALKAAAEELADEIQFYRFLQYKFLTQWKHLKQYVNSRGIRVIGDIPIYVAFDNADAWANPELFQFDENHTPKAVAGCPPDAFTADGQLWGNPLYDWDYHRDTGYQWWIRRTRHSLNLYDVVRIDHFRGFDEYYAVPYGSKTARNGTWRKGPGLELFDALRSALGEVSFIAEDLGLLTDSVIEMVEESGFPGMKVLEFAFDSHVTNAYLPDHYQKNCVVYTGTHDNNTLLGWYRELSPADRAFCEAYLNNANSSEAELPWDFIRLAFSSVADLAVVPMQDVLGLGAEARMNYPSSLGENWKWRMQPGAFTEDLVDRIRRMTTLYDRIPEQPLISAEQPKQDETFRTELKQPEQEKPYEPLWENPTAEAEAVVPSAGGAAASAQPADAEFEPVSVPEDTETAEELEARLNRVLTEQYGRTLKQCTKKEIFHVLMTVTREKLEQRPRIRGRKKLYYISAEFLIGKLLSNNLINLGLYEKVNQILKKYHLDLTEIEEMELEPSLGNGGLGRLAACFLDSIATLGLYGDGVGLNYHCGLFRQQLIGNKQREVKNPWITENSWLRREPVSFRVPFRDFSVDSVMYDIDVPGYENGCNRLHLFDLDSVDENIVGQDSIGFDKRDIRRNLTLFLYPDDSEREGQLLRIYQQYFMVSNAAQLILKECDERGVDLHRLNEFVVVQINDTHPSLVIPELIRLLRERGFSSDEAIAVVQKTCAYTNHTILAEALETWPEDYLEQVVPHLMPIIRELDDRARRRSPEENTAIIDADHRVHMAHMDIHYGFSVNGVAALHTDILKKTELKQFYQLYPEKFNNKTNGITFRRWLLQCNPALTAYLEELIGSDFRQDAGALEQLLEFRNDPVVLERLAQLKRKNKKRLCRYLYETQNLNLNADSIFDVQIKRLHEYKRQQMNALYAIHKYLEIKSGKKPETPITMIFGAKAAPAYVIAKDIIHMILCLEQLTASDASVSPYFRVIMVENYNVSKASALIPAADISEQISLASKEASGTGNMKFMLNGAVTIGTEDGANVEIHELVGDENIYIFGKRPDEVISLYETGGYRPGDYYENVPRIRELVDFIVGKEMMELGDPVSLERLHAELVNRDWFMTLLDLEDYIQTKERAYADYEKRESWNRKALVNIAKAGYFSADRTIAEYNREIWQLRPE